METYGDVIGYVLGVVVFICLPGWMIVSIFRDIRTWWQNRCVQSMKEEYPPGQSPADLEFKRWQEEREARQRARELAEAALAPAERAARDRDQAERQARWEAEKEQRRQEELEARAVEQRKLYERMLATKEDDAYRDACERWQRLKVLQMTREEFFQTLLDVDGTNFGWEAERWKEQGFPNPWEAAAKAAAPKRRRGDKGDGGGDARDIALAMEAVRAIRR